jgi:thymidylate synthase (FAD)
MNVELVSYTKSEIEGIDNLQELVAYCARVSNPDNQLNNETSEKLITYLIENEHWSPLEMVNVCLEIKTTRDIARQILRHRSFSFQEFSQRYANPTKELNFVNREARLQDKSNRQNSIKNDDLVLSMKFQTKQSELIDAAIKNYKEAIEDGIAKEQARCFLPEGLMLSKLYMNGNLRSWIHYIQLRSGNGTQKEHMEIAKECACVISKVFPLISKFVKNK